MDLYKNVFFLFNDEMIEMNTLDVETIRLNSSRIQFYYGANDGWVPSECPGDLRKEIPNVKIEIADEKIGHGFMIKSSEDVAQRIAEWINLN